MPELPEVETLATLLRPLLIGKVIDSCRAVTDSLRVPLPNRVPKEWRGFSLSEIRRRGKYLLLPGPGEQVLILHLGMTGWMHVCSRTDPHEPHLRWCLRFVDGTELRFIDPRKFGQIFFTAFENQDTIIGLPPLGFEPLAPLFTGHALYLSSRQTQRPLKTWLLDQSVVAGLGNIYASESLFLARLSPLRSAASLSYAECVRLCRAIRQVLRASIKAGSTCAQAHPTPDASTSHYELKLWVYERDEQPCLRCKHGIVQRIVQSGRSTYWCPACQKTSSPESRQQEGNRR